MLVNTYDPDNADITSGVSLRDFSLFKNRGFGKVCMFRISISGMRHPISIGR